MLSQTQMAEKAARIKKVVDSFLMYDEITILELEEKINVPKSTIQRDLNNIEYIQMIYSDKSKEVLQKISNKLKSNYKNGIHKGGIVATTNYEPVRDEDGKFIGNKKR